MLPAVYPPDLTRPNGGFLSANFLFLTSDSKFDTVQTHLVFIFQCMRYAILKLLPVIVCVSLLTGCAVWTGGFPSSYRQNGNYPVVASIHGIKDVSSSVDLSKTVVSYTATNEIVLNTNTTHGWMIQIPPAPKRLLCQEFYILPKAAHWGATLQFVSIDKTTCVTGFFVPKGERYISRHWGMYADDPLGEYEIAVFLDKKLAADFKFRVVGKPVDRP